MNKNKSGFISMTLVYTFLIIFLFLMLAILRTYNEKDKFLEAIDEQISEDISANVKTKVTIINRILDDNSPMNEKDAPIRFFNIANSHFGNGNGLYYSEDSDMIDENDDGRIYRMYYFRGTTERNHIVFAGYCWRILRTNEDGSLRLRFNGPYNGSSCYTLEQALEHKDNITIGKVAYMDQYESDNPNDYLDFVKKKNSTAKSSNVSKILEDWYWKNIAMYDDFKDKVADELYCNDTYTLLDKEGNEVAGDRLAAQSLIPEFKDKSNKDIYNLKNVTNRLTFKCSQEKNSTNGEVYSTLDDAYDMEGLGNHRLAYPIGILTAQDVVLAGGYLSSNSTYDEYQGGRYGMNNESYYLYTGFNYWTMSPYSNSASEPKMIYVDKYGKLAAAKVQSDDPTEELPEYYVVPVISLKDDATIASGHGTSKSPYIVR